MVTTAGAALDYYTPEEIADMAGLSSALVQLFFTLHGYGDSVRADRLLTDVKELMAENETAAQLLTALGSARSAFIGPEHARMILNPDFTPSDRGFTERMDRILEAAREVYGNDYYITGGAMSNYDIGNAFRSDLLKVNLITFLAIFAIVSISFLSLRFAFLLIFDQKILPSNSKKH